MRYTLAAIFLMLAGVLQAGTPISENASIVSINKSRKIIEITLHPQNYLDKSEWREIDTQVSAKVSDGFTMAADAQKIKMNVDDAGRRRINISTSAYLDLGRMQYKNDKGIWADLPIDTVESVKNQITIGHKLYRIIYTNLPERQKMDLVISSSTFICPLRMAYSEVKCKLSGSDNDDRWIIEGDGSSAMLEKPFIYRDGNGYIKKPRYAEYTKDKTHIYITVDARDLVLPIYIDPSVIYSTQPYQNTDTYIEEDYPTDNAGTEVQFKTGVENVSGTSIMRALMKFDLSSIPSGSLCLGATLYINLEYADNPSSDQATSIYSIRSGRSDLNYLQATWNIYKTGSNWGTAGCSNTSTDYNSTAIATFNTNTSFPSISTITINTTAVSSWFGAVNSNYGIMIKQDVETNNYRKKEWSSSRSLTAANRPKLVVEYSEAVAAAPSVAPMILLLGD